MSAHDEPVGSLGSEAAQLFEALQDWARETGGDWGAEHIATGSAECTYCPLCRVISALRDDPEVRRQISAAATSIMDVVVGLLADVGRDPQHDDEDEGRETD